MTSRPATSLAVAPHDDRLMLFVIGAQKAGTSWLHSYLASHPDFSAGPLKEYHFFNKFHSEFATDARIPGLQALRRKMALASVLRRAGQPGGYVASMIAAFRGKTTYMDLVQGTDRDRPVFGDVTPIYGLLGPAAFTEMAQSWPRTKFVFILRDPVDRLWSHARMRARRKDIDPNAADGNALRKMAFGCLDKKRFLGRSDYERTITALETAVPAADILYLFYEDLFTDQSLQRLCDFAGLRFVPGQYDERVFAGITADAPEGWARAARDKMAGVYDFVARRFGARVPAAWGLTSGARDAEGAA